jgi:glyoxalase family protein
MNLNGLHHVTAVTSKAQQNLNFYTGILGMRLVKKTVNQDDVSAYHLFYADKLGSPGTDLTFFDWAQMPRNVNGSGSIARTSLRVPSRAALDWWAGNLTERGIEHSGMVEFHGHELIYLADPEGQQLALVGDEGAPGAVPWDQGPIPIEFAVRGLYGSTLITPEPGPTTFVLTEVMGYVQTADYPGENGDRTLVFETAGGGPGKELYVGPAGVRWRSSHRFSSG